MRALLIAFVLGCVSVGALATASALAVAVLAEANGWRDLRLAAGPLLFVAWERGEAATATTFGPGLVVLSLLGGALNAFGAALLRRRE